MSRKTLPKFSEIFSSGPEYFQSPLWDIIRREVIGRDVNRCRYTLTYCNREAIQVAHTSYDIFTLMGLQPGHLVSFCDECWMKCVMDETGNALDPEDACRKTFSGVSGIVVERGVSNPRIGHWYFNQKQANVPVGQEIAAKVKAQLPDLFTEWYPPLLDSLGWTC